MKDRKNFTPRVKLTPTRRAQLSEAGVPKFMFRLLDMRPAKCGHTETFAKRHD